MTTWELYCALYCDVLIVLGLKCDQHDCDGVAVSSVHWPSGVVRCCDRHTARWREIADAMGVHMFVELLRTWMPVDLDDAQQRFRLLELN